MQEGKVMVRLLLLKYADEEKTVERRRGSENESRTGDYTAS